MDHLSHIKENGSIKKDKTNVRMNIRLALKIAASDVILCIHYPCESVWLDIQMSFVEAVAKWYANCYAQSNRSMC